MRKYTRILSIILTLVMVMLPMYAHAERLEVKALQFSNPVVQMDGETLLDLNGLTLQVSGGSNEVGSLAQLFIDIIANGEYITSGIVQVDDSSILALLSGMTSAYSVPMSSLSGATTDLTNFMDTLANWTLPEKIAEVFTDISENGIVFGEPTAGIYEGETATYNMAYVPFTSDLTPYINEIIGLINSDEFINSIKNYAGNVNANTEDLVNNLSAITLEGKVGMDENSVITTIDVTVNVTKDDTTESLTFNFAVDATEAENIKFVGTVSNPNDESAHIEINGAVTSGDMNMDIMAIDNATGDITMGIVMSATSTGGENADTSEFSIDMNMGDDGRFILNASHNATTGAYHIGFDAYDETISATVYTDYTPAETIADGYISNGKIVLGIANGLNEYVITADTATFTTEVESEDFINASTAAIDLTTITEEQQNIAMIEVSQVLYNTLSGLEAQIPGLAGITQSIFGSVDTETEVPAE